MFSVEFGGVRMLEPLESDMNPCVRVLVSFYLTSTTSSENSAATQQVIHKEKFNVPLDTVKHKNLTEFMKHIVDFTGLANIATDKGLGQRPDVSIGRVNRNNQSAGIEVFSIRTQDAWSHEFSNILSGNAMLQGRHLLLHL